MMQPFTRPENAHTAKAEHLDSSPLLQPPRDAAAGCARASFFSALS